MEEKKLLTVSIAAYNVEAYIRQTLDSLLVPECLGDLEVLIEDDGATDATAEIAAEYEARYPGTFRLIRKENGGYGSTVNRSVREASGKYFRLLDGDDRVESRQLGDFLKVLRETDADWVISRMKVVREPDSAAETSGEKKPADADPGGNCSCPVPDWADLEGREVPVEEIPEGTAFSMWQMTVRTDFLKAHHRDFPEHTLYTDQLFVTETIPYVHTVRFTPEVIYCYRIGRAGQSVSRESRCRHYHDTLRVLRRMIGDYHRRFIAGREGDPAQKEIPGAAETRLRAAERRLYRRRLVLYSHFAVRTILLLPKKRENQRRLVSMLRYLRKYAPDVYADLSRLGKRNRWILRHPEAMYLLLGGREKNW